MPSTKLSRRGINRRELRSEIEIDAPPERVWESLIGSPDIPQPLRSAIGERRVGERLKVHLKPRGGRGATFRIKLRTGGAQIALRRPIYKRILYVLVRLDKNDISRPWRVKTW